MNNKGILLLLTAFCLLGKLLGQTEPGSYPSEHVYVDSEVKELDLADHSFDSGVFHLFTHGKPGHLYIDGAWLNIGQIRDWMNEKGFLQSKSHLNIYGCEFGRGIGGERAVQFLEMQLGVSVAASNDTTGVEGDWELEVGSPQNLIQLPEYPYNLQNATLILPP